MTARVFITGGTGLVGRFIAEHFLGHGADVTVAGRTPPAPGFFSKAVRFASFSLSQPEDYPNLVEGHDLVVHGAFDHVPGRYRGGEGDDPEGFRTRNLDSSKLLHDAAANAGAARFVFLSSRAVYGSPPPGTLLTEDTIAPDASLYGTVKAEAERYFARPISASLVSTSLRITGVYGPSGPGRPHKWDELFHQYTSGDAIAPRPATEVHGEDVARAVSCVAEAPAHDVAGQSFNVSDIIVDRADILAPLSDRLNDAPPLPPRGDQRQVSPMATAKLEALGWRPSGRALFDQTVAKMADDFISNQNTEGHDNV